MKNFCICLNCNNKFKIDYLHNPPNEKQGTNDKNFDKFPAEYILPPCCEECNYICNSYFPSIDKNNHFVSSFNPNPFSQRLLDNEKDSVVHLPKKTIYSHENIDILYDFKKSSSPQFLKETSSYSDKNVLLIGCGSIKRLSVLQSLKLLSFKKFVCLDVSKKWAIDYFDEWIIAESEDVNKKEATLKAVKNFMIEKNIKFDAIFTYDDYCVLMAAYLQQELGFKAMSFEYAEKIKNKYEFRRHCASLDINHPNFFLVLSHQRNEFLETLDPLGKPSKIKSIDGKESCSFPLIIKHTHGSGKDFVRKCSNIVEICECIKETFKFKEMDFIIEEFYEGHEIDIEILIQNNQANFVAISDNFPPLEPYFFEQGGVTPSLKLSNREQKAIGNLIEKWISKMNFQNAILHFEARCRPESIYGNEKFFDNNDILINEKLFLMPIEINLRLAGAETWSMIKASCDVDLVREYTNIMLGIKLDEVSLKNKWRFPRYRCISRDFHPAKNVTIKAIGIKKDKVMQDDVVEISVFRSVEDKLCIKDYIGWISVKSDFGDTSEEKLSLKLESALECLIFEFIE